MRCLWTSGAESVLPVPMTGRPAPTASQQAPQPIQIADDFPLTPLIPSIFIGSNFDLTSNQTYPPHSRKVGEVKYQFLIPQWNPMSQTLEFIMRILKLKEVLNRTGLGKTTLYALIGNGDFPQQIPLGLRAVGWLESEVDAWILEKIESRSRIIS